MKSDKAFDTLNKSARYKMIRSTEHARPSLKLKDYFDATEPYLARII